jgi:hypothetical protein
MKRHEFSKIVATFENSMSEIWLSYRLHPTFEVGYGSVA